MLDPGAIILGAAIASSWYLACYFGGRYAFLNRQLDTENVGRFFGSLGAMAPWYYLKPVLLNSAPLSLLVPVAAVYALLSPIVSSQSGNSAPHPTSPPGGGRVAESDAGGVARTLHNFRPRPLRRPPLRDLLLRHRHLLQHRRLQTPIVFVAGLALRRGDSRVVDRHRAAACLPPRRDLVIRRAMRRARRLQLHLYTARGSAILPRRFISPRRRGDRSRRRARPTRSICTDSRKRSLPSCSISIATLPCSNGRLGDAPPGFIVMPAQVWKTHQSEALDFEPVLTSDHGNRHLVLVKRGKSYASSPRHFLADRITARYLSQSTM